MNNKTTGSYFFKAFTFVKPFIPLLFATILLNTIFSTLTAITVATIKPIFELIFNSKISSEEVLHNSTPVLSKIKAAFFNYLKNFFLIPNDIYSTLLNLSIFIIVLFVLKNSFKYFASITNAILEESIIRFIRNKLFAK